MYSIRLSRNIQWNYIFAYGILLFSFSTAVISLIREAAQGGGGFRFGEWLINYGDGFIRRGLFGEIFLTLTPSGSISIWILCTVLIFSYFLVLVYILFLLHKNDFNWHGIALACSPAALPFIGWDSAAFARKEVLGFILLVYLAIIRTKGRREVFWPKLLGLLFFALAVLSSEVNAVMLPGVIYLLREKNKKNFNPQMRLLGALALVIATVGVALSKLNSGSLNKAQLVCEKIRDHDLKSIELCSGSISYLAFTTKDAIEMVLFNFPSYLGYLPLLLLSSLPIVTTRWFRNNSRFALTCLLVSLPLYIVGADYGRWIFILILQLTICCLSDFQDDKQSNAWTPMSCGLYVGLWGLPHYGFAWPMSMYGLLPSFLHAGDSLAKLITGI